MKLLIRSFSIILLLGCASPPPKRPITISDISIPVKSLRLPKIKPQSTFHKKTKQLDFWHSTDKSTLTFTLALSCLIGAASDPPGKEGVAALTLSLMKRATIKRSTTDMIAAIDGHSAQLVSMTNMHGASFVLTGASWDFDYLAKILKNVLLTPRMDPNDFKNLNELQWAQTLQSLEIPDSIIQAASDFNFYKDGRERYPIGGSPTSLRKITMEDAFHFYEEFKNCPQWKITFSSPWPNKKALRKVKRVFKKILEKKKHPVNLPALKVPQTQTDKLVFIEKADLHQSHIIVRKKTMKRSHPDYAAALLTNEILGGSFSSRLNQVLREKENLTYGASSSLSATKHFGEFSISLSANADKTFVALDRALDVWKHFAEKGANTKEIAKAKNHMTGLYPFQFQSRASTLHLIVFFDWVGLPGPTIFNFPKEIESLTQRDIQRILKTHLAPKNYFITILGPNNAQRFLSHLDLEIIKGSEADYLGESPFQSHQE